MVNMGDKIEGSKVVKFLCHCKHPKKDHDAKEKIGSRVRVGDHYETSIIFEKNMGKCTQCKCKGYKKGSVLLENGDILRSDQYFKCDECGEYLNKKKKSAHRYYPVLCKACVPVYYKRKIFEADNTILEVEQVEAYLEKNYPDLINREVYITEGSGYCEDYNSMEVSMGKVIDHLLESLKEHKEEWERYIT